MEAGGQPLNPGEVTGAMKTPEVKASFDQCALGTKHPSIVKLVIIINEEGSTKLSSTIPTIEKDLLACFQEVTGTVKIRATGQKYKMVYSLHLPAEETIQVEPAPMVPEPATGPVAAPAPSSPTPSPEPAYYNENKEPLFDAKREKDYRRGTAFFVSGIVLTIAGGATWFIPAFYTLMYYTMCSNIDDSGCDYHFNPTLLGVSLAGVAVMGLGIGLLAKGVSLRRKTSGMKKALSWQNLVVAPDLAARGAVISSVWHF